MPQLKRSAAPSVLYKKEIAKKQKLDDDEGKSNAPTYI